MNNKKKESMIENAILNLFVALCFDLMISLVVFMFTDWLTVKSTFLWLIPLLWIVSYLIGKSVEREETQYLENLQDDDRSPFLILRSFTDKQLKEGMTIYGSHDSGGTITPNSFVHDLTYALEEFGRSVILDKEEEGSGPNQTKKILKQLDSKPIFIITSDQNWELCFDVVAKLSKAIFIFPSDTPGVVAELDKLTNNPDLLCKTWLIMPPMKRLSKFWRVFFSFGGVSYPNYPDRWNSLKKTLSEKGYQMPEHKTLGMIYRPQEDLSIRNAVTFPKSDYNQQHMNATIAEVIEQLPSRNEHPFSELFVQLGHQTGNTFGFIKECSIHKNIGNIMRG